MILRSFLFSLQASYRFLISTCYFTHLHGFSTENLIPDLLSCAISISKVSFMSVIALYHCAQPVHFQFKLYNVAVIDFRLQSLVCDLSTFLRSNCFKSAKNAILMILRSFLFSLQASYRFLNSTCYFAHHCGLSAENFIPDLLSSAISI